jgi:guanylate kinase/dTMP kinase
VAAATNDPGNDGHWNRDTVVSGLLVAFEGVDGSGKSTLQDAVAAHLAAGALEVVTTFEPGGSDLGSMLRPLLLDGELDPRTQLLLFAAERSRHVRHVIRPALRRGAVVLCDRFEASSVAYQSHWLGLPERSVRDISRFASDQLRADLTVWVDVSDELARARRGDKHPDRLDAAAQAASATLSDSFARQCAAEPHRWLRVDGGAPLVEQAAVVVARITTELADRARRGTLLVVAGPSGAGKNTIVEQLLTTRDDVTFSVSVTTRPPRPGERPGRDYHFIDDAEFDELLADGGLLEWACYAGHRYGTPAAAVQQTLAGGGHVVAIVELSGAEQIRVVAPDAPVVFVTARPDELAARLNQRGSESASQRSQRLAAAHKELAWGPTMADVVVDGGDAEAAVAVLSHLLSPAA